MKASKPTTAFDMTVYSLCDKIDRLEDEVAHWRQKYENEVSERNAEWKERGDEAMKGVANALMFALSVSDDANGNLVISKDNRQNLAENWE
jgi:hypothetical protein